MGLEAWQSIDLRSRNEREGVGRQYKKRRLALIEKLGGKCVDCGTAALAVLEFDHLTPRTWKANRTGRMERIRRYEREAADGEIELRCRECNNRKGKPK